MKKACKSKKAPNTGYLEMQSRVRNLNCFRSATAMAQSAAVAGPVGGGGGGGASGGDSATFAQNSAEDFALAPVFGLDRREIAATAFVHGTEEHHFHRALTALQALQRLRRRHLLLNAVAGSGSGGGDAASGSGSPRSSTFTWDLVDEAPDAPWDQEELGDTLPDIAEEGGDADAAGDGAGAQEPLQADTLESLTAQFEEAVESLTELGTAKAKRRAQRLTARFTLAAHDLVSDEQKEESLHRLSQLCKVKFNHKPPNVPGASLAQSSPTDDATLATSIPEADYQSELQLRKHIEKCINEGRRIQRVRGASETEWAYGDSRCAAFWQPLTQIGRARLFTMLARQLAEDPVAGTDDAGASTPAAAADAKSKAKAKAQGRGMAVAPGSESGIEEEGESEDGQEESEEDVASDMTDSADGTPRAVHGAAPRGRGSAAYGQSRDAAPLTKKELVPVLARGLEFVGCPEDRGTVCAVLLALVKPLADSREALRAALLSPAMQAWFPRLREEERSALVKAAPRALALAEFVALYLRVCARPPSKEATADELLKWADEVGDIVARAKSAHDKDKPLMSEVCIYALHHSLVAREQAAWLQSHAAPGTRRTTGSTSPVMHSVELLMTVPREHLKVYLDIWRPFGSSSFVPGEGNKSQRAPRTCTMAADMVWQQKVPDTAKRAAVKPEDDEALVERLCSALVASGGDLIGLSLAEQWAARVKAEAQLLAGSSDASVSQAYTKAKGDLSRLTERTEVEFEKCNRVNFDVGTPTEVLVRTKNCGALAVRIFEVDAWRYYVAHGKEVPSDLSLEGLEPNAEVVLSELQQLPPLKRNLLRLRLPFVERGGVYVLELIGNGVSCRALLYIGALHLVELERSAAGQSFAVYDRGWQRLESAKVVVDGAEYESTDRIVTVPYTSGARAGQWSKAVACSGCLSGLFDVMRFDARRVELRGGFFVDEEQLLEGNPSAVVVCRVQLFQNEERMPLGSLKSAVLQVSWKHEENEGYQLGGQHDIVLQEEEDNVSQLEVPRGARGLKIELTAKLANDIEVKLEPSFFVVHGVSEMCSIFDLHLCPGFELQALGRSGESVPGRSVEVSMRSAFSTDVLGPFKCQTDAGGRITLGSLKGIVGIHAKFTAHASTGSQTREWHLGAAANSWNSPAQGQAQIAFSVATRDVCIPVPELCAYTLEEVCLEPLHSVRDLSELASSSEGVLRIVGLPLGKVCRLCLFHPDDTSSERLLLAADTLTSDGRFAVVDASLFEWRPQDIPPRIESATLSTGSVKLRVANAAPGARVHVVARRFWRPLALAHTASRVPLRLPSRQIPARAAESSFLRTRRMGDIVRYVLERRPLVQCADFTAPSLPTHRTAPFPGVCVHGESRGSTKWDVHGDSVGEQVEARQAAAKQRPPPSLLYKVGEPAKFSTANVSFIEPSAVLANRRVGSDGTVEVALPSAGKHAFFEVLVTQPNGHACTVLVQDKRVEPHNRDMRLMSEVLDPTRHYGEVHGSKVLAANDKFELSTPSVSQMQVYDTLPQVFEALYALLNRSSELKRFEYVKKWPELSEKEKLKHYSQDACHELHLFLFAHDPAFFEKFVVPLLANRRRYGRLDRWLLQLQPGSEAPLALTKSCRIEQLLVSAALPDGPRRAAQLQSLLRLCDEDASEESKGTSLDRRTKAYDVMLRPHAAQLAPDHGGGLRAPAKASGHGLPAANAWMKECRPATLPPAPMRTIRCASLGQRSCDDDDGGGSFASMLMDFECEQAFLQAPQQQQHQHQHQHQQLQQPHQLQQRFLCPPVADDAWFCRPAQRVTERGWLAGGNGPKKGAAALWREAAAALLGDASAPWPRGFVSAAALEAGIHGGASEALCALALLDLPFAPKAAPDIVVDEARQVKVVTARGPSVVFFSMVREVDAPSESSPLLLTQELKSLAGNLLPRSSELLVNTVIKAEVLAVNCGSEPREMRLLLQCPEGAVPVGKGSFYTRSVDVAVPAFGSSTVENHFYFPQPGSFRWFPAHALADERLVAFEAASGPLNVVAERGAVDVASWRDVAARGSLEEVLAFLRKPSQLSLSESELSAVAWRMREKAAFDAIVNELRLQMRFCTPIWGYGFKHHDLRVVKEFLEMNDSFQKLVGPRMESELLSTDALDGSIYSHCDFDGLVLSRAHTVGARRQNIEDADLRKAYADFLSELAYASSLSLEDRLVLTNFMLLQDRVDEARVAFEPVKDVVLPRLSAGTPPPGPLQLQAAYHMAYLDLIGGGELAQAKMALTAFGSAAWLTSTWKARFGALAKAVASACQDGAAGAASDVPAADADPVADAKARDKDGARLSIEEVDTKGHRIRLASQGLRLGSLRLACYVVDVELTFSAAPFTGSSSAAAGSDGEASSHVTAIAPTVAVSLDQGDIDADGWVALPEDVRRRQMVLEVTATSSTGERRLSAVQPCYYCDAKLHFDEKEGVLMVEEGGRPAPGVYVKVFVGTPQAPRFYKDGYTDCTGALDYAASNAAHAPFRRGAKLAVLVLSKSSGALVREVVAPPLKRDENESTPFLSAPPAPLAGQGSQREVSDKSESSYDEGGESEEEGEDEGYGDEF